MHPNVLLHFKFLDRYKYFKYNFFLRKSVRDLIVIHSVGGGHPSLELNDGCSYLVKLHACILFAVRSYK